MDYDKIANDIIRDLIKCNYFRIDYNKESIKDIIKKHVEQPPLKLEINEAKVRNVVTGEIR